MKVVMDYGTYKGVIVEEPDIERDEKGRFREGHSGAIGVVTVRRALRDALQRHATVVGADGEEFNEVWIALTERAKRGDPASVKMFLEYTAGKPVQEIEVTARQAVSDMSNEDLVALAEQAGKALVGK